ncbi:AAA family ATPase [Hymenobacter setariae]|uniref:AAA family ATPase n=1 Tax=Hymenobacter setariae TaxID=2594794 RepID=A0A558BK86_9BACT|nr:AAA family ATPase [Hymenobacter setariae]TVT36934.1 AAA family ATPase [Hymenobacter setariae]
MKTSPIYVKSIKLTNIETFVEEVELKFLKADDTISRWTLILGDNGIGKSNLLQFIAWMKPQLPYDANDTNNLDPAPVINDEENEVLERLVHKDQNGSQEAVANALFVANQSLNKKSTSRTSECKTEIIIGIDSLGKLKRVDPTLDADVQGIFYKEDVTVYGYSASRQLGKLNLNNPKLLDTIPNFIREKTELYDAEEILHTLQYAALGSKKTEERQKYRSFIKRIKQMLVTLLPDFEQIQNIEINPPTVFSQYSTGGLVITTRHGQKIPFNDFSLGYKTITSWVVDLAWRLFSKHHLTSENPLEEPAIVLIDEIDLHLHPKWQQQIMSNLSLHFPNIQFIATAHSPLMVQAAFDLNYAVLHYDKALGSVSITNRPEGVDGWRVDQILTSDFFDLKSARGTAFDKLLSDRDALLAKKRLTEPDKRRLKAINAQLAQPPTSENIEEVNNRRQLAELVQKMRNK